MKRPAVIVGGAVICAIATGSCPVLTSCGVLRSATAAWRRAVRHLVIASAVSIGVWGMSSAAARQACDPSLEPIPDTVGYSSRKGDARCEGFYVRPIAGGALEVVSLTVGRLRFDPAKTDALLIGLPDLVQGAPSEVYVRATALPLRTYYRMDATLAPGTPLHWPTNAVLRPQKLDGSRLGILGWVGEGKQRLFVPLIVRDEREPATAGEAQLVLLAASPLDHVMWRERSSGSDAPGGWRELAAKGLEPGERVTLTLPPGNGPELSVEIMAQPRNSDDWEPHQLRIARPRR
jgi:hypothetical protein